MGWCVSIAELSPDAVGRFGGKACALARLVRHRIQVPDAVVLPVETMSTFLEHNGLLARMEGVVVAGGERRLSAFRKAILAGEFPADLREEVLRSGRRLGLEQSMGGVAVRSSAVEEDGREYSFAGQYSSFLNVLSPDGLLHAIQSCWASWFSMEAWLYRSRSKASVVQPGMAVLIQSQISARSAGVLFTVNPHTGSWREMILEACWGQGEALVSGQVRPDRMVLWRPRKTPKPIQRVLARVQVETLEVELGGQTRGLFPDDSGGLVWRDLQQEGSQVVGEEDARRIGRLGLRAEALAGCPQDLEWVIDRRGEIYVLQSRPITAAEPTRGDEVLWTRRFFGERWTEPATPMGWSILQPILHTFIAYPKTSKRYLGGEEPTQLLRGRPYFNVTVFRHLLFKFPGAPPPRFLLEFLPRHEERRWLRRRAVAPGFAVYASILGETIRERRWQRFRWNPLSNPRAWDDYEVRLNSRLDFLESEDAALDEQFEEALVFLHDYIKIHICSLLYANIFYQICEGAVPPDLKRDLLRCPVENRTQMVNRDLYSLLFEEDRSDFIERHGHRSSSSSWEIFSVRWAEDPSAIDRLMVPYVEGALADPGQLGCEQEKTSQEAFEALKRRSRTPAGLFLVEMVRLTRRYLQLREDQRYLFDRLLFALKKNLQRQGVQLFGPQGQERVAYLYLEELRAVQEGALEPEAGLALAKERKKQWDEYQNAPPPPVFLKGQESLETEKQDHLLRGLGISAGVHTGRVRILRSPEEAERLEPGDILVTTATDPGWTPLFLVAGAVVLELGSMLSHGAVLAREYGLPAVVNVNGLHSNLVDGQKITVDGTRGVVWLISK